MRIIAGTAGGRPLIAPEGKDVRPTGDKVRGAMFNALRSRMDITGAVILDCFCGSGALGLEALSRGAASCTFIDNSRASLDLAKKNAKALGFENQSRFVFSDMRTLKPSEGEPAVLAFLDPPYEKNLVAPALAALAAGGWLHEKALCVVEAEKKFHDVPLQFSTLSEKRYGETKVLFLQLISV